MDLSEITNNPHRHPWEMSRADFVLSVIGKHVRLGKGSELLDIGAGDLFFSEKMYGATSTRIDAVDNAFDDEVSRNEGIQKIKYLDRVLHKKYDAICALDVLEHIEDDREFLGVLLHMLKPGASLTITVPAFNFLFSRHDVNLRHFRRYSFGMLNDLIVDKKQFQIAENFYFFHSLFFVRLFEKFYEKMTPKAQAVKEFKSINHWQFAEHHPVTKSLGRVLGTDAFLCRMLAKMKVKVPGLSLCVVIKNMESESQYTQ